MDSTREGGPEASDTADLTTTDRTSAALTTTMRRAFELARRGPAHGPNPRVGCVLLSPAGQVLGEGWHRGAGTPHAEPAAVRAAQEAGADTQGATAVVSLEPCSHTGRTGPCTEVLLAAGVRRVVHAVEDPDPAAAGGAATLRAAGVEVHGGVLRGEGEDLLRSWLHAVRLGRPWVTLKLATTLDGRVAAADGTSRWITSSAAREHAHAVRAQVDAIAVGTGTALADDPALTARDASGALSAHQPLRVVLGAREIPPTARLHGPGGELVQLTTHDVAEALHELGRRQVRHLLVEGGPTLSSALLRAGLVDEVHAYLAPVLLGAGAGAVGPLGISTITEALRLETVSIERLGPDVLVVARPLTSHGTPDRTTDRTPTEES